MRFGIMAMQIDYLVPSTPGGIQPEQMAAHVLSFDHAALVQGLANHGFKLIELGGDLGMLLPHTYSPQAIENLAKLKTELGLTFTVHLPLWSVEPSTLQQPVRHGSVQVLVDTILATCTLEPEVYVLHATGALAAEFYRMRIPEIARSLMMQQFQNNARLSIQTILAETGINPRQLAIETIEFPFELTMKLSQEFDTSICLDTGHILAGFSGPVNILDVLEQVLPRLGNIHLHDSPWQGVDMQLRHGEDHQTLGHGDLDVGGFLDRLNKAGYMGPIIFELRVDEALESLNAIRALRPMLIS
jgi:sugar phosphate isomerase/epimerase